MKSVLEFKGLSKSFGKICALDDVTFSISQGEFFSILGPSGCGKTSLLRIIAGLEKPDQGRIFLDGADITDIPAHQRPINTVFQNYALFPHLTIWENIAFGPQVAKVDPKQVDDDVMKMLKMIQMEDYVDKYPSQISGGQKQRVAIARALINKPRVLLLDEPLAALDLKLRQRMLVELDTIHDQVGIIFIYVTHDQNEAMAVSDRMMLLNQGGIEQIGTPVELYEAPSSSFTAAFIGDTNFLNGCVVNVSGEYCDVRVSDQLLLKCYNDKQLQKGRMTHLSIRPEKVNIARSRPDDPAKYNVLSGVINDVIYYGDHTKLWVKTEMYSFCISKPHGRYLLDQDLLKYKEEVWIWWHPDDGHMLETYCKEDELLEETLDQESA